MKTSFASVLRLWASIIAVGCTSAPTPRPALTPRASSEAKTQRWLDSAAQIATSAGAGPLSVVATGAGRSGSRFDGFVQLDAGECALFLVRGSEAVRDVDLFAYGDSGVELVAEDAADDLPTTLYCSPAAQRLYLSAELMAGHGFVSVGMQRVPTDALTAVRRATNASPENAEPNAVDLTWPELNTTVAKRTEYLGGHWTALRRIPLPLDARVESRFSVDLRAHQCVDVVASPSSDTEALDMVAFDATGREFARGQQFGSQRVILLCGAEQDQRVDLALRPRRGRGTAAVALSQSGPDFHLTHLPPDAQPTFLRPSPRNNKSKPSAKAERIALVAGELTRHEVPGVGCRHISLSPTPKLWGFRTHIWNEEGQLLRSVAVNHQVELIACSNGPLQVELEPTGPAAGLLLQVTVLRKNPQWAQTSPNAAGLLLTEHAVRTGSAQYLPTAQVRTRKLSPQRGLGPLIHVDKGSCVRITIAAEGAETRIDAWLLDSATLLDSVHHSQLPVLRYCSPKNRDHDLQLQLRASGPDTTALVAIQPDDR